MTNCAWCGKKVPSLEVFDTMTGASCIICLWCYLAAMVEGMKGDDE